MLRALLSGLLTLALLPATSIAAVDPLRAQQWNLDMIGADAAHATSTGAGAVVAVVDSGVQADHPDLAGRLVPGVDLVDHDATPQDGDGHGTHVTGIIAAATGNGTGIASVAPGARVMPIRVLGDDGSGSTEDVAAGIDAARERGADVINLSLGSEVPIVGAAGGDALDAAIRRALAAGIVVVAAVGNSGVPLCEQPAAADGLLCVGAVDRRGRRAFFSSFGLGLGLVAPGGSALPAAGEGVLSTYPPGGYEELSGTSQAAPHVAGVAALLVSLGVRGQAAVQRILATATDAGPPGVDPEFGHGLVNAAAAVAGLHAPASGASAGGGCAAGVHVRHRIARRAVRRRGVRVGVCSAAAGSVRVRVVRRGRVLARGRARLHAGRARTVVARPTRRGRHARRGRARVVVRLPGESRPRVVKVVVG